jgi:hypothetical protein
MGKRLSEDDAQAVDLLLDRSNTISDGAAGAFARPLGDETVKRLGAAETIFRLLAETPAADPPADLVKKTMDRIRERGNQPSAIEETRLPITDQEQA